MENPQRLIDTETGEALRLLRAGSEVGVPPAGAIEQTLLSLGLGGAAGVASAATTLPWVVAGKWLAVGFVVGGTTSALLSGALRDPQPPEPTLTQAAPRLPPKAVGSASARQPSLPPAIDAVRVEIPPTSVVPTQAARSESPAARASTLAQEIAYLDRARAALGQTAAKQALDELDAYTAEFPTGQLEPEAALLRVRAYSQAGRADAARALAERLLLRSPNGDYAARVREAAGIASPP